MTNLVRVTDEPWGDQVAVYLITEVGGHRLIQRPGNPGTTDVVDPGTDPGPSMRLDYDTAQALMHALAHHFGQVTDSAHTRADYDAERARTDRLTTALITAGQESAATVRAMLTAGNPDAYRSGRP